MRLYVEDKEIYLDYMGAKFLYLNTDKSQAFGAENDEANDCLHYMMDCACGWEKTQAPQVKRMCQTFGSDEYLSCLTPYGIACEKRRYVRQALAAATYYKSIEISFEVLAYYNELEAECARLRKIEEEKAQERKRKEVWESLCKHGCGRCKNKLRDGDDYRCGATGGYLPERPVPEWDGTTFYLLKSEAFPTGSCPYNAEKEVV